MAEITFRKAQWTDLDFILDGIIASEKSGTLILSYCALFELEEAEFREILITIFKEEIENQPWCLSHWKIGLINRNPVCCLTVWSESTSFQGSDLLKIQLLEYFIPEKWEYAKEKLKLVAKVSIPRKVGYLQLEHLYTLEEFRGKGIMRKLLRNIDQSFPDQNQEIQLMSTNIRALKLYESEGFILREEKCWDELYEMKLLPSNCKLSLTKKL